MKLRLRILVAAVFPVFLTSAFGQGLVFRPLIEGKPVLWETGEYHSALSEKWRFSTLSFYLSDFSWYPSEDSSQSDSPDQRQLTLQPDRVELLSFGPGTDSLILLAPADFGRVCFRFGLDSATQVSGRMEGVLDPALGMYWAWNTGYIQCRMEGFSPDSKEKKGRFEFHIGGYARPFACDHRVCLNLSKTTGKREVIIDLQSFADQVSLRKTCKVLTPGPEAFAISTLLTGMFRPSAYKKTDKPAKQ